MKDLKVRDVMTNLVVTLAPTDTIHEAAALLARNGISGAPVVDGGKVVGVISESDIISAAYPPAPVERGLSILDFLSVVNVGRPHHSSRGPAVTDAMSPIVVTIGPDDTVWEAATVLERRGIKRLPVTDEEGFLVGIISRADIVRVVARDDESIRDDVEDALNVVLNGEIDGLIVKVDNGVATLSGTADRRSTATIAVRIAARLPGVTEVRDHLDHDSDDTKLRPGPPRTRRVFEGQKDPWAIGPLVKEV